jgi:uncharacterized protein YkwD
MPSTSPSDDPYYNTRLALVKQINRDRASAGLSAVELDLFASLVGDEHCQEMAAWRYLSHWDRHGLLPYHRYHLAGGRDHVEENLSQRTEFSSNPYPFGTQPPDILPLLLQAHQRFMEEKPPQDGHRRNVLHPPHTHAAVGFAVVGQEFTMTEQFLNRYVRLEALPFALPAGPIQVEGEMLRKDMGPYYCMLFYEGLPKPRTVHELERTYSYTDTGGEKCGVTAPWQMRFESASGRFRFSLAAKNCGPGYYHLLLWVRGNVRSIPYELQPGVPAQIDTAQAIPTAGWVFRR